MGPCARRRPARPSRVVGVDWRGRVLGLLPRLGLRAVDVLPGAVLVSRRAAFRVRGLDPDAALVIRRRSRRRHWFEREKALTSYAVGEHVAAILGQYRVNLVIDVGANRGQYAKRLRRAGYRGRIASFEPVPETFERLREAAAGDVRWSVHPFALGSEDTETSMQVVPGTLSSLLAPSDFGAQRYAQLREPAARSIQVRRLDGMLDELTAGLQDPRIYLKLDTQGYDVEAFRGAGARVREFVGMQSEVALMRIYEGMPRLPEALALYEQSGFEVTALYPVSRETATARVLEFDCVMVRADAAPP